MSRIRPLSDSLITKIAAGEVVERPASVVKELVENAIDAGATRIDVELLGGGRDLVSVRDDGFGMEADDVRLALKRHATSKLSKLEDLNSIATLGFRGEALAAIAAVSRVDLRSAESAGDGFRIVVDGGRTVTEEPISQPQGTCVEVSGLFSNVPARRKFLKQAATEQRRCLEVVQAYALVHTEIAFQVEQRGKKLLEAPAVPATDDRFEALRQRIDDIFGRRLAQRLIPFGDPPEEAEAIWGMIGNHETSRGRKVMIFVNGRLLRDRGLVSLFFRAARDEWGHAEFPSLFLFLNIPPDQVDVNVHPQKHEVRFGDPALTSKIYRRLRRGLATARSEDEAPIAAVDDLPPVVPAWTGLGGRRTDDPPHADKSGDGMAGYIAEPNLIQSEQQAEPALGTPIPLSGRDGRQSRFRILGQYKAAIVLVEGPDALYLIDQHVAHERVLFERILGATRGESMDVQPLLEPVMLDLDSSAAERLADAEDILKDAGFEIEVLSGGSVAVSSMPASLSQKQGLAFLREVSTSSIPVGDLRSRLEEVLAASFSCRRAVKMHDRLPDQDLEALIGDLFDCDNPYACPHGRPVMLRMSDLELEKSFHRR